MTLYYPENRSFMNLQTVLCCLLAVGIHIALLSLDIPGTNRIPARGRGEVSLRVIHPAPSSPQPVETILEATQGRDISHAPPSQPTPKNTPAVATGSSPPQLMKPKPRIDTDPSKQEHKVTMFRKLDAVPPLSRLGPPVAPSEDFEAYTPPVGPRREGVGHSESDLPPSAIGHAPGDDPSTGSTGGSQTPGRAGGRVTTYARPEYEKNRPPDYPRLARRRGYEGRTRLNVEVLETGKVGRIEVAASSGFDLLDEAALEAVKGWRFIPGKSDGKRISQWVVVPVRFRLD